MLTEKECRKALYYFLDEIIIDDFLSKTDREKYSILEQLIEVHFSNPPLEFEELKEDMFVWDNKECEYIFIDRLWISDSNKKMMIYKGLGSQVKGEFIEGRFYRKEVHK